MESPFQEHHILEHLDTLGISYRLHRHPPVFTVEEAQKHHQDMPGGHSKNLFLRDKKKNQILVVAQETTPVRLNELAAHMGLKRLSFGSPERLMATLGVEPGSVTPFALLHAQQAISTQERPLKIVLDEALMAYDQVYFHPLHNAATVGITPKCLLMFIESTGHTAQIIDLEKLMS